jgi:hypothetical protein
VREVLVAERELAVQFGDAAVGTAGVLRGRPVGGLARRERPLASVICACLRGAGCVMRNGPARSPGIAPGGGARRVGGGPGICCGRMRDLPRISSTAQRVRGP